MENIEIQWLAGLIEGEGYFGFDGKQPKARTIGRNCGFYIGMTDEDVIQRVANLIGTSYKSRAAYTKEKRIKDKHYIKLYSSNAASVAQLVQPLMSQRRYDKIKEVFGNTELKDYRTKEFYIGLFEAEAWWTIRSSKLVRFGLKMCDRDTVEGARDFFGNTGNIYTRHMQNPNWKEQFNWQVDKTSDVLAIMNCCSGKMGNRRQAKLDECFALLEAKGYYGG